MPTGYEYLFPESSAQPKAQRVDNKQKSGYDHLFPDPNAHLDEQKQAPQPQVNTQHQQLRQLAESQVAKDRAGGGILQSVDDFARNLARGTPVGSFVDELNAATASGINTVTGGTYGAPYDQAKAYQDAYNRAIDGDSTKLGSLPLIGDVTAGGVTKLAGGLLSAPVAPMAHLLKGGSLLPQIGNATATGVGYGALYGAGEGNAVEERAKNAGVGGLVGAGFGVAAPVAANAIGKAVSAARAAPQRMPAPLRGFEKQTVNSLADTMEQSRLTPQQFAQRTQELGPEGMLADLTPQTRIEAGALARTPGDSQTIVLDAVNARNAGAKARLDNTTTGVLGPAHNIPVLKSRVTEAANNQATPLYEAFHRATIPESPRLNRILQRAEAAGATRGAHRLVRSEGFDPDLPENFPRVLDGIKRELDAMAGQAEGKNANQVRVFGGLADDLRREVDLLLSPAAPEQSIYAQARGAAGDGLQFNSAVNEGQKAFRKGTHPDQMRVDLDGMTPIERTGYQVGARSQVRDIMGDSATKFGDNGDSAALRALGSENARAKLQIINDQPLAPGIPQPRLPASELVRRLNAESDFARTDIAAQGNSATSTMTAVQKKWANPYDKLESSTLSKGQTVWADSKTAALRLADFLVGNTLSERTMRINRDAAEIFISQGARRDELGHALISLAQQKRGTAAQRTALARLGRQILSGAQAPAISQVTSQ